MSETASPSVRPYEYQVGGHSKQDGLPASLKDEQGRFLKKLQAGDRGDREVAFYEEIERYRQALGPQPPANEGLTAGSARSASQGCSAMHQLARWVPHSYGTRQVAGATYLVLEDIAAAYQQPCLLDVKVGYRTWYPWASDSLQQKYRLKDESTTQSSCGFRVCGVLVHNAVTGATWRVDRHWGKQLTPDNVGEAFTRFADNGHISLSDLLLGPGMLLEQLQELADLFKQQQHWHFFSTSLLLVYEGSAQSAADLKLSVKLIDFAHTFLGAAGGDGKQGPSGVDHNFLSGLESIMQTLQRLVAESTSHSSRN